MQFFSEIYMVGDGAWGLAMAHHLSTRLSQEVVLISRKPHGQHELAYRQLYPDWTQPSKLELQSPWPQPQGSAPLYFLATPSSAMAELLQHLAHTAPQAYIVSLAKGLCQYQDEVLLQHEWYQQLHPKQQRFAYLYGPSFASELYQSKTSCVNLGSHNAAMTHALTQLLQHPCLQLTASTDLIAMALGAVFKNLIALGSGLIMQQSASSNTRAAFITRALQEVNELIRKLGGNRDSSLSLAVLGDTLLSAVDPQSRNYKLGLTLATTTTKGPKPLTESLTNLDLVTLWLQQHNLSSPLVQALKASLAPTTNPEHTRSLESYLQQTLQV